MTATMQTATFPVVTCAGTPRERGLVHGEALRPLIADGLGRWMANLESTHGIDADSYLNEFISNSDHISAAERWTPDLLEEVRGIAAGSGQSFERIFAYNLMDEEWSYGEARRHGLPPGCTAICIRTKRGTTIVAQNMDLPSVHDGTQALLRIQPEQGPEVLAFTLAGYVGLMGANAAGIGMVVNNLSVLPSSSKGLPVAFVLRGILAQTTPREATDFVKRVPHSIGQHYAIGSQDGLVSLEAAANGVFADNPWNNRLIHTNHPLVNDGVVGDPTRTYEASNTIARYDRAVSRSSELTDVASVEQVLSDTTAPISCAPKRGFMTFASMSAELTIPPRVRFAPGPPHLTPYENAEFSTGS